MRAAPVEVRVPGDKSITHRALILASLADGESRLRGMLDAADTRSTASVLRLLGADAPTGPLAHAVVTGEGIHGWSEPSAFLDCGNSGTTARLLLGALAGCPFESVVTGDDSLRSRPMRRVTEPLSQMGAEVLEMELPNRLPVRVRGQRPLRPLSWDSPRASGQVKTALLLAGIIGRAAVRVREPVLSRDHTERLLRSMGVALTADASETQGGASRSVGVALGEVERLEPLDLTVPGDFSSAAYFLALGALAGSVRMLDVGLNPTRTGALRVIERMGARVRVEERPGESEPAGDVLVQRDELRAVSVAPDEVPGMIDEIPLLAVLAAVAEGETRFDGVSELRVKESDRVQAVVANLRNLGVDTADGPDHLVVHGGAGPLRGHVRSFGDHRIAMAFGVLGAIAGNDIEIEGREAVDISFPSFWNELERVRGELYRT